MNIPLAELEKSIPAIEASPKNNGILELIVARPVKEARRVLDEMEISLAGGLEGDNWANGCWMSLPDGSPHPDVQIAMTNSRCLAAIAGEKSNWPPAGDSLFVDLDISEENLKPGDRLSIGTAVIEITSTAHTGCQKFSQRYGVDALKFVNAPEWKSMRLRGIYARVVKDGRIRVGDRISKLQPEPALG